jgi:trimethylamine--corrinoid protein Co-methyltransferase
MVGAPQFWAIDAATVELEKDLGLPVRAGAGVTDSHALDMQAGVETAMGLAAVLDRGADFILHAGGTLGSINAVSLEKLVIDDELAGVLRSRPLDIVVDDETLALPVIDAVGPGGSYLAQKHTRVHGRNSVRRSLFNRRPYAVWRDEGRDLAADAAAQVRSLLDSYEAPELDEAVRRRLEDYCLRGGARR